MIRVKICGITNVQDALVAVQAGADALGFIFVENTPRCVTPSLAAAIVRRLPPFVTPVGVFWDHPRGHVKAVAETCGLGALQFHGDEKPEDLEGYGLPVIKTIKLPPASTIEGLPEYRVREKLEALAYVRIVSAILLDSSARWSEGEEREPIEWQVIRALTPQAQQPLRIILSGGLTPDNVAHAVGVTRPYAVDVNSGVEAAPGRKDPDKVRRFIAEARRAS
ncbi:MAG: phosphoribosylanthranilate isomerase [Candidatus Rokubacteria bacterium]|nr:phosphoribosylanthranilate isomerase [Candidatus Rokubacteria bacterium]